MTVRGRSFRAQNLSELCGRQRPGWNAFVETGAHRVGIGWTREGIELRLNETHHARVADVVKAVPLQLIDPLTHRLLDEGPAYRRSFIDWGVFHVEHDFLGIWRRYQRALKQRNTALRDELDDRAVQAWNEELALTAVQMDAKRQSHVDATATRLSAWALRLLGTDQVRCEWQRGWPEGEDFREVLDRSLGQHRRTGSTAQGPHRAELKITLADSKVKGRVSRGQQKMLVAAMVLAQSELLVRKGISPPILLLDDFASELAPEFQSRLAAGLSSYPGQKFVTAFDIPPSFASHEAGLFHVEHGTIRPLSSLH